ncbi:hypothetical protein GQ600_15301 [Phytophthora cactorum]|nr:hypothetical protein GQ600_15301 [Phytophthora cactorum]
MPTTYAAYMVSCSRSGQSILRRIRTPKTW